MEYDRPPVKLAYLVAPLLYQRCCEAYLREVEDLKLLEYVILI